ncbi:MAG: hypothetical protein H6613_00740 [Ignavibacteriales bacterium]|nr:hypothetical protein [Ignavibacteriota bacterium]MCB9247160.1 hypothetical protein [Ignavibacteriales bacterium]
MKKQRGSFFKSMFIVLFTIAPLLFAYMFFIKGIKDLNALKNTRLEELREKENKLEVQRVEYQKLTSEDEVVKKAKDKFDLVRIDNLSTISVNKNQINNIKKFINKKYD